MLTLHFRLPHKISRGQIFWATLLYGWDKNCAFSCQWQGSAVAGALRGSLTMSDDCLAPSISGSRGTCMLPTRTLMILITYIIYVFIYIHFYHIHNAIYFSWLITALLLRYWNIYLIFIVFLNNMYRKVTLVLQLLLVWWAPLVRWVPMCRCLGTYLVGRWMLYRKMKIEYDDWLIYEEGKTFAQQWDKYS